MDELREKIADIVQDALDQHGLDSYGAADRILAIPEIAEALAGVHLTRLRKSAEAADRGEGTSLAGLSREELRGALAGDDKPNLGHSIRVRDPD